jgi:hypothetical protein
VATDTSSARAVSSMLSPPKKTQLDEVRLALVQLGQLAQRLVEVEEVGCGDAAAASPSTRVTRMPPAWPRPAPARGRRGSAASARGHPEELLAVLPERVLRAQAQVRLVDEVGGTQGVAAPLPPQIAGGPAPQLLVDERMRRSRATSSPLRHAWRRRVTSPASSFGASAARRAV